MAKKMDIISEYEAASVTFMSPDLLRWFTGHAPKSGISRKLKVAKKENGAFFYDRDEVLAFDAWLKQPWPRKDGKRPVIPAAIRKEIKVEANGACAICHGHKDTCEAAHLEPVAKTDNNHPENLLWLCSNHHTAYDGGLFGPIEDEAEFVLHFKTVLRRYKVMLWRMQAELSFKVLAALENCNLLSKQLELAKTSDQVKAIETVAKDILDKLPTLAPMSKTDPRYAGFQTVSVNISHLAKSRNPVRQRLNAASVVRAEYVAALGMVTCPLCKGMGHYEHEDCPVCGGDREIDQRDSSRLDLDQFRKIECPLCEGKGTRGGEHCPACGGERSMERRYADRIVVSDYLMVDCPICGGSRTYLGGPCHACCGEGEMEKRHADMLDIRSYDVVDCPLCKGTGRHEHEDCPECQGDGSMPRRFADEVDLRGYESADCPVCDASGKLRGEDCPVCQGEGNIDRRYLDRIDVHDYDSVQCPVCEDKTEKGRGECRACGGDGRLERRHADRIDPSEYR